MKLGVREEERVTRLVQLRTKLINAMMFAQDCRIEQYKEITNVIHSCNREIKFIAGTADGTGWNFVESTSWSGEKIERLIYIPKEEENV